MGEKVPVTGFWHPSDLEAGVMGFVAAWRSAGSVSTWSGHYRVDRGTMTLTWILTEPARTCDEWQSTRIGHDAFGRLALDDAHEGGAEVPSDRTRR